MQFLAYVTYICDNLWFCFPLSLRLRYKKQMQQITPSPLLRLSFLSKLLLWIIYHEPYSLCTDLIHLISSSLVFSFSYIMTNWVDMRALMFSWMQHPGWSDSAPSQGNHGPVFALLLPLAQCQPGRAQACGPEWAVAHSGQDPAWAVCSYSWGIPLPADWMELQSHCKAILLI